MKIFRMIDALLRDRSSLYEQIESRDRLGRFVARFLAIFLVTAGLYGAGMGAFRMIHPEYFFSDARVEAEDGIILTCKVAGMNAETKSFYFEDVVFPHVENATVRFNITRPTDPYKVASFGEEKGYAKITLSPDSVLEEPDAWRVPLLVAVKTPALFVLTLLVCSLALYILNLGFGIGLHFMPTMALMAFALAATGIMLGVFVPIAMLFTVVTGSYHFMKVMHLLIFSIAGLFGVKVLYEGLLKLSGDGLGKRFRASVLLIAWLMLYSLVGGQMTWTLKPFLGTPYLPSTPPFRMESGNIYVSFFRSMAQMGR